MTRISVSFIDLFVILTIKFLVLWVISMLLMNPSKKEEITAKPVAEFLVKVTWDAKENCDIDTWICRAGVDSLCGFKRREVDCFILHNDNTSSEYGVTDGVPLELATETISINKKNQGVYRLSLHGYAMRNEARELEATVTVEKVNPYKLVFSKKILVTDGQESKVVEFEVDSEGRVIRIDPDPEFLHYILKNN